MTDIQRQAPRIGRLYTIMHPDRRAASIRSDGSPLADNLKAKGWRFKACQDSLAH